MKWFSIQAKGSDSADIDIFDEIGGWGIRAQDFIADLKRVGAVKNIRLRVNSYGGEVFDGIAIYNALKRHPATVTVEIYGIAASIASIIAMAGDKVIMPSNTFLFLHDPLALVIGDADDLRDVAADLEKTGSSLVSTYMLKTGKSEKEVRRWMSEDTWFTAAEALAAGLADEVTDAVKLAARADLARYKNLPPALQDLIKPDAPTPPPTITPNPAPDVAAEIRELCKAYDVAPMGHILAVECQSVDEANRRLRFIEAARDETAKEPAAAAMIAKAKARMLGILEACIGAGHPELAKQMIDSDLDVEAVKATLADPIENTKLVFTYDRSTFREISALCLAAGVEELAAEFVAKGTTLEEVKARLAGADAIRTACTIAHKILGKENSTLRAKNFILAGATPQEVRYALSEILAAAEPEVDNQIPMAVLTGQRSAKPVVDISAAIYKHRRDELKKLQARRSLLSN